MFAILASCGGGGSDCGATYAFGSIAGNLCNSSIAEEKIINNNQIKSNNSTIITSTIIILNN